MIVWLLACGGEQQAPTPAAEATPAAPIEAPAEVPPPVATPAPTVGAEAAPAVPDVAPTNPAVTTAPTPVAAAPAAPAGTPPITPGTSPPTPTAEATPAGTPVAAPAVEAKPVTYTLDAAKSSLYVQVFKDPTTVAADLSHDHVVSATKWTGSVTWGAGACAVDISVPVSGLRNDDDAMRKRVGYNVMLDDGQRADVKANMLGASQLDGSRFTTITYKATRCESSDATWKVTGGLTIHGVTKQVVATLKVAADAASFAASGKFTTKTRDFGFEPFSAMLGALKNKDELKFTLDVVGSAG
jgi:polyisoprenoid-binding protein YceI